MKILFFKAPNCAPCEKIFPQVKAAIEAKSELEGKGIQLKIIDVSDVDNAELATKYRVMRCPTIVMEGCPDIRMAQGADIGDFLTAVNLITIPVAKQAQNRTIEASGVYDA